MLTPALPPPFPLEWGFSTRIDPAGALPPVRLVQVHGADLVQALDGPDAAPAMGTAALADPAAAPADPAGALAGPAEALPRADGIWTCRPGLVIGVRVADCVPVLLAGPLPGGRPWAAALHAGWRGTVAGILDRGVATFRDLGGRPEELCWVLGPAILKCHFEVGEDVLEAARRDPAWREALAEPGPRGRPHLDLHGLLRAQGERLGLAPERFEAIPACTYCSPGLLHSYRRGDRHGRQWGWIRIGAGA